MPEWHSRHLARETELSVSHASADGRTREGYIDGEIVKRYMHTRVFPRASACYNRALTANQVLEGRVVFEFELGKGEVMHAALDDAEFNYEVGTFLSCLEEPVTRDGPDPLFEMLMHKADTLAR
jgi:hypothetical protein